MNMNERNFARWQDEKSALIGESAHPLNRMARASGDLDSLFPEFIGRSPLMVDLMKHIHKAATTDSPVLIYGESGTGKELVAAALHRLSGRSNRRFVPINCSAIPEDLLETELFGHEKGAFTGASQRRIGHFEAAKGGTIFLDEIGDMPPKLQVKLLRVLQEKQFSPVGSSALHKADVRIVAATNVNLEEAVQAKTFRLDLFYRLNVLPMTLPPLRARGDDIQRLLEHFLQVHNNQHHGLACHFSSEAMNILRQYSWPGNVRELQNLIERLVIMSNTGVIQPADLPQEILRFHLDQQTMGNKPSSMQPPAVNLSPITSAPMPATEPQTPRQSGPSLLPDSGINLTQLIEQLENSYILQALERTNNNKNKAAKLLGINRTTLVERIKKRGLMPLNSPSREL